LIACHVGKWGDPCLQDSNVDALKPSIEVVEHVEAKIVEYAILDSASNN
jgi:hypothetical protein